MIWRTLSFLFVMGIVSYIFIAPNKLSRSPSSIKGLFPQMYKMLEQHVINNATTRSDIKAFIRKSSYDGHYCNDHYHGDYSAIAGDYKPVILSPDELASEIFNLSKCFKIDPGIFTSLIYKESQFCNFGGTIYQNIKPIHTEKERASETLAGGLTMFTTIGAQEVYDQLYNDDRAYFNPKARVFLHNMMANCNYANHLATNSSTKEYFDNESWLDDEKYMSHNLTIDELKRPEKWRDQLLYGAIKLKVNLVHKQQPETFVLAENAFDHYVRALKKYNSAGGIEENQYWRYILSSYEDTFNPNLKLIAQDIEYKSEKWENHKENIEKKAPPVVEGLKIRMKMLKEF